MRSSGKYIMLMIAADIVFDFDNRRSIIIAGISGSRLSCLWRHCLLKTLQESSLFLHSDNNSAVVANVFNVCSDLHLIITLLSYWYTVISLF